MYCRHGYRGGIGGGENVHIPYWNLWSYEMFIRTKNYLGTPPSPSGIYMKSDEGTDVVGAAYNCSRE
jgi:hypothetical protein